MKTFHKILIANRGEIAVRVIQAAQKSGIRTIAVYAADDADSLHVSLADEAVLLSGETLAKTYLNPEKIIQIALESGAKAIHPGYGFLSENADFAQKIADAGLVFIGPTPENIRLMGEKNQARLYSNCVQALLECSLGFYQQFSMKKKFYYFKNLDPHFDLAITSSTRTSNSRLLAPDILPAANSADIFGITSVLES